MVLLPEASQGSSPEERTNHEPRPVASAQLPVIVARVKVKAEAKHLMAVLIQFPCWVAV